MGETDPAAAIITGRCYCGATSLTSTNPPQVVSYCHCQDCRRHTGAPVAVFAAFAADWLCITPQLGDAVSVNPGVDRWFCRSCGSPLAARFDYLPGQIYVPIGLLDQAADLTPQLHSHAESCLPWLHIADDLPRAKSSSRVDLKEYAEKVGAKE